MDRFDPVARLQQLTAANDRITSNLLELEADPTVAMLDAADLRGVSADQWTQARQTLAGLFAAHTALKGVIETATRLSARPLLLTGSRLHELDALLNGPSIVVSDTSLGLADRGLLSDSRCVVRRSADQLIDEMSVMYEAVKSVVVRVTEVWERDIPRLRSERARSLELARIAEELGVRDSGVAKTSNMLREISDMVLSDPLAVETAQLDEIATAFDRVEHDLGDLRALALHWPDCVNEARALLDEAVQAAAACGEAVALANSRVVQEHPIQAIEFPIDTADALERAIACGDEDRLGGGTDLVAWRRATAERIAELESVIERSRTLLGQRDDLRARLEAYSAKAARLGLLEDDETAQAFESARRALYTAPTDLHVAGELVGQYQRLIAERGDS